jgi:hypothetical protein
MIDSYSQILFPTKKSQELDEVIVLLEVDLRGKLSGFEVQGEVDKVLKKAIGPFDQKITGLQAGSWF